MRVRTPQGGRKLQQPDLHLSRRLIDRFKIVICSACIISQPLLAISPGTPYVSNRLLVCTGA